MIGDFHGPKPDNGNVIRVCASDFHDRYACQLVQCLCLSHEFRRRRGIVLRCPGRSLQVG